ncbi:MAG: serine protease, partial [Alphaproteobacteria bacterium]|nr:serine protease [Alphaproteobacteria bacterium]
MTVAHRLVLASRALAVVVAAAVATSAFARPAPDSFADLAARLLPAVVNISTTQTLPEKGDKNSRGPDVPQFPPG